MGERVDCVVLDVGQGSGNFYEVYNATDQLIHTALLDLGSELEKESAGGASVDYIVQQLKSMTGGAQLDVVMLSHSDSDHINLVTDVLAKFSPDGVGLPKLVILTVAFAGERAKYKKKHEPNVIDELERYIPQDGAERLFSLSPNHSSFTLWPAPWTPFTAGPLKLYVLIANAVSADTRVGENSTAPSRQSTGGYALNTNSIIVVADYQYPTVTTGDATGITIAAANQVIDACDLTVNLFIDTFMVTAPHHGSRSTTFDIRGIKAPGVTTDQLARVNLKTFVDNLYAKNLSVSAERKTTFKHPSMEVLEFFWPRLGRYVYSDPLLTTSAGHWMTGYFTAGQYDLTGGGTWPATPNWYTVQTTYNVFTNLYFVASLVGALPAATAPVFGTPPPLLPLAVPPTPISPGETVVTTGMSPPPLGAMWLFRVPLHGTRSVLRSENRTLMLGAERAARARVREIERLTALRGRAIAAAALPPLGAARPARPVAATRAPAAFAPSLRGLKVLR